MSLTNSLQSLFICFILSINSFGQNKLLEEKINILLKPFQGKVGVSIKNINTKEEININAEEKYPMQSVYKLPLAMAVFDKIEKKKYSLNQQVALKKSDLLPNTHSPLRDKYPSGNSNITLKEIIEFTVSQSDNNGCDYLFRLLGGCENVNKYIKKHQKTGINIVFTEEEMHLDSSAQYKNFAQPKAITSLIGRFYEGKILNRKSTEILWKMLVETTTAPNRIKGELPKGTIVGHKSGWSGGDDRGFTNAINDTGVVILPNGHAFAITILIKNTVEKSTTSDALAAKITKLVFDYFMEKKLG